MSLPSVPSQQILHYLKQYGFSAIWNHPGAHRRSNVELTLFRKRLCVSSIPVDDAQIPLPTNTANYVVYTTPISSFWGRVDFTPYTWYSAVDIATQFIVDLPVYTLSGRIIDPTQVFYCFVPELNHVLIVSDVDTLQSCSGEMIPVLYQTLYSLSHGTVVSEVDSYTIPTTTAMTNPSLTIAIITNTLVRLTTLNTNGVFVCVNGYLYPAGSQPAYQEGDRVVIVSDPNVVAQTTITIDDEVTGYFSDVYKEYRELLHIPKALNPDNLILNANDLTMIVRDPVSGRSVYCHRAAQHTVEQVTHNDFTISRQVLNALRDTLGASAIELHLFIRFPTTPIPMSVDAHHILDLYRMDDQTIISYLLGLKDVGIPEWLVTQLETSPYLQMTQGIANTISTEDLDLSVAALGYYRTGAILTQSHATYAYDSGPMGIKKPYRLYGMPIDGIVFAGGRKVRSDRITFTDHDATSAIISYDASVYIPSSTQIDIFVCEAGDRRPVPYSVTADQKTISLESEDVALYQQIDLPAPIKTISGSSSVAYRLIPPSEKSYTQTTDAYGAVSATFADASVGTSGVVAPLTGLRVLQYQIDQLYLEGDPLILPITVDGYPILTFGSVDVYLNGYRLVPNIDYTLIPVKTNTDDIVETPLVITNTTYIGGIGNLVEVVISSDVAIDHDVGYAVDKIMPRQNIPDFWDNACGRAFIRGTLLSTVEDHGPYLTTSDDVLDGVPYLSEWKIPYGVLKYLSSYSPNQQNDLLVRIDKLLDRQIPAPPEIVKITQPYVLYSPYLTTIIDDLVSGTLVVGLDPDDTRFLQQFSAYDVLRDRDPVIGLSNKLINRNYVDITTSYQNKTITDISLLQITQRLISLVFNNKLPVLGETLQ